MCSLIGIFEISGYNTKPYVYEMQMPAAFGLTDLPTSDMGQLSEI